MRPDPAHRMRSAPTAQLRTRRGWARMTQVPSVACTTPRTAYQTRRLTATSPGLSASPSSILHAVGSPPAHPRPFAASAAAGRHAVYVLQVGLREGAPVDRLVPRATRAQRAAVE